MKGRLIIARHGQTVFNAAGRMQGDTAHTPLTRAGFAQAEAMGEALRLHLGPKPEVALWASPTGRALQTLAVIAEHLELDWHQARTDPRLGEIGLGDWSGRYYHELAHHFDPGTPPFSRPAPGGESYAEVAERLRAWIGEQAEAEDRLVIMHGVSSRVLRGLLTGLPLSEWGAPIAPRLAQGSLVEIVGGAERVIHGGTGAAPAS